MDTLKEADIEPKQQFLESIFQNQKCTHLSDEEKSKIKEAYELASLAHKDDKKKNNEPYMIHIRGTVMDYLDKTTKKERVSADDIMVTILHDVIEDHPNFSKRVFVSFDFAIYQRILGVTKPSPAVIIETFGTLTNDLIKSIRQKGVMRDSLYIGPKFMKSTQLIETHRAVYQKIISQWDVLRAFDGKWSKNWLFLWYIADLSEDDFEIKCADRVNNLGSLEAVDIDYVEKNMQSTEIYIEKAKVFNRHDLVALLERGVEALQKRKQKFTPPLPPSSLSDQ